MLCTTSPAPVAPAQVPSLAWWMVSRLAVREELQQGATQIKIMASGDVSSPTEPIANTGYSEAKIPAIIDEAEAASTYVIAHAYTALATRRAPSSTATRWNPLTAWGARVSN